MEAAIRDTRDTSGQLARGYSWADKRASSKDTHNEILIGYSIFAGLDYIDKPYYNLSTNIGMIRKGGKEEIVLTDELYPYCASREKILPSGFLLLNFVFLNQYGR